MTKSPAELREAYPEGTHVLTVVDRVEPFGVFVRMEHDLMVVGLIRPREWSWGRYSLDVGPEVKPGDRVEALVLRHGPAGIELSRRRRLPSPYPTFSERHAVGDLVEGSVRLSRRQGVLVILDEMVEGFIPRSEIPDYGLQRDGFGLLMGDRVQAAILAFNNKRATVVLSVREVLHRRQRWARDRAASNHPTLRHHPSVGPALENISLSLQLQDLHVPKVSPALLERLGRILVVEDNEGVSESLGQYLNLLGLHCDIAQSVADGCRRAIGDRYGLVILDINLPGGKGSELIDAFEAQQSVPIILVVTGASEAEWGELIAQCGERVHGIFRKPTQLARLLNSIEDVIAGREPADDQAMHGTGNDADPLAYDSRRRETHRVKLTRRLDDLRRLASADSVFVLGYQPGPRFDVIAGPLTDISYYVAQKLEISPVGNAIRRSESMIVQQVSRHIAQFRHLLEVMAIGSFAAHPIPYRDRAEYGLFLIGKNEQQLTVRSDDLRRAAHDIGQFLAEERLDEVITENQTLLATGFLADSLLHEIRNSADALNHASGVQALLGHRYASDLGAMSADEVAEFKKAILRIQREAQELTQIIELFRNLAGQTDEEEIELACTVQRLVRAATPLADDRGVSIETHVTQTIPSLRLVPRLLEQPLLNMMINGIEQMALTGGSERVLTVSARMTPSSALPVVISVNDTGPGIHHVHRERVFELFFTTKPRGTGLGLYLSRNFIERLGGEITLSRSIMYIGTEFCIRLPRSVLA